MNTRHTLIAVTFALIAGAAGAADLVQIPTERGALTRAEVQAELLRARNAGELTNTGDSYGLQWAQVTTGKAQAPLATRSRDDARNEARGAVRQRSASDYVGG